jgi:hypothetical protein
MNTIWINLIVSPKLGVYFIESTCLIALGDAEPLVTFEIVDLSKALNHSIAKSAQGIDSTMHQSEVPSSISRRKIK